MRNEKKVVIAVFREEQPSENSEDSSHHNSTQVISEANSLELERLELPQEDRVEIEQLESTIRKLKQVINKQVSKLESLSLDSLTQLKEVIQHTEMSDSLKCKLTTI